MQSVFNGPLQVLHEAKHSIHSLVFVSRNFLSLHLVQSLEVRPLHSKQAGSHTVHLLSALLGKAIFYKLIRISKKN